MSHTKGAIEYSEVTCNAIDLVSKEDDVVVTQVMGEEGDDLSAREIDNAHRLVLCWNSHDDLLVACKAALEFIGRSNKTDWDNEITPVLEAAIAKAEKGKTNEEEPQE